VRPLNCGVRRTNTVKPLRMLAVLSALLAATARAASCEDVSALPQVLAATVMKPGSFRLVLIATSGRRTGGIAEGELDLRVTSSTDRSPRTGQLANDRNTGEAPLYGWAVADWKLVDAPVRDDNARSRDPVFPGVLVKFASWREGYSASTPVLLISTVSNRGDGEIILDGGGIGLWVRQLDENGFAGEWSGWGIAMSGSGFFCATPLEP
jgi:hypothetical protein